MPAPLEDAGNIGGRSRLKREKADPFLALPVCAGGSAIGLSVTDAYGQSLGR